jgi:transporter family-2 protein
MSIVFPSVLLAVVAGMAIALQSLFSGVLGRTVGVMESVFIIHLGGLLVSGAALLLMRGGNLAAWKAAPWYAVCGGVLGVVIVGVYSFIIPRIGLAPSITLAIAAQLVLGAILNHCGLLGANPQPFTVSRIVGIAVLFVGTWLIVR